ncbi:glycosyltransferase family 52 [Hoeflea sp. CAU 1731]
MNLFFIRTRLECLIAMRIVDKITPNDRYAVVFLYQKDREEDSTVVYELYNQFRNNAAFSHDVVGSSGVFNNLLRFIPAMLIAWITGGACYLAVVGNLPLALAARMMPWITIKSFDDGAVNILPNSHLYGKGPANGNTLKRKLTRGVFPNGVAEWMRERITQHFTIFPNTPNIVDSKRLTVLDWDWSALLNSSDLDKLNSLIPNSIIVGTPHDEFPDPQASRDLANKLLEDADLYVKHPREKNWHKSDKVIQFHSPAESVLAHFAQFNRITVYHFNSTVGYTLSNSPNIVLYNLVDPITRKLNPNTQLWK